MIKTFAEAVKFLSRLIPPPDKKFLGKEGFERMEYLVNEIDNPQLKYPTIHVGGTSGKGSTATIIASILATKYKVGLNTSPHLERITERIKINNKEVTKLDFIRLVNQIIPAALKMRKGKFGKPSHFEALTAMAFLYFWKEKVDIAVIEVGLGGKWDGTNVIKPETAVLTNVGLDHTQVLGNTVEKIAADKVGIIKRNIHLITGVRQQSVIHIVEEKCKREEANLSILGKDFSYKIKKMDSEGSVFDYSGEKNYKNLEIRLIGKHQVENAALAIRAIECMNARMHRWKISEENMRNGLRNAFITGRMETVRKNPLVMLDGAHNPDKVKALVSAIKKVFPRKRVICVLAIKNDKDAKKMIAYLSKIGYKFILTKYKLKTDVGDTFSYQPEILAGIIKMIRKHRKIEIIENSLEAVKDAIDKGKKNDLILVTGSLYLVGKVRKISASSV